MFSLVNVRHQIVSFSIGTFSSNEITFSPIEELNRNMKTDGGSDGEKEEGMK
jgi:hypothetical protein